MSRFDSIDSHRLIGFYLSIRKFLYSLLPLVLLVFLALPSALRADITTRPSGAKGIGQDRRGGISPTVLLHPVIGELIRGGEVDMPIAVASPNGGEVLFQISKPPRFGSLQRLESRSSSVPIYRYVNDSTVRSEEDSFEFRAQAPGQAMITRTATIRIKNPPGSLSVIPGKVDFGKVAIGSTARRTLLLCNSFGAPISGTLLLPAPWFVVGDGVFSLAEKETQPFEIEFRPTESKEEITELRAAPEIPNFPSVPVSGEGIVPFLIDTTSAIVSTEHPRAVFRVTNSSARDMTIDWTDDTGLLCSLPVKIPPHGSGEVWLSIGSLHLENEERKELHPALRDGNFELPLEVVALGPRGKVTINPLRDQPLSTLEQVPITLHGVIESTSSVERSLQIRYREEESDSRVITKSLKIPPHATQPFLFSWSAGKKGDFLPSATLLEEGRSIGTAQWKVAVRHPETLSHVVRGADPVPSALSHDSSSTAKPSGGFYRLSRQDSGSVAVSLSSSLQSGLFMNSLVLHWLYRGEGTPHFVIEEKVSRNALTDRSGESGAFGEAGETGEDSWRRIQVSPVYQNGGWSAGFSMPWPGEHVYRVYPTGCPAVIMAQISVTVTWKMYLWPAIKAFLGLLFLICLIKVLRERF
jgi:hypothetical protein